MLLAKDQAGINSTELANWQAYNAVVNMRPTYSIRPLGRPKIGTIPQQSHSLHSHDIGFVGLYVANIYEKPLYRSGTHTVIIFHLL